MYLSIKLRKNSNYSYSVEFIFLLNFCSCKFHLEIETNQYSINQYIDGSLIYTSSATETNKKKKSTIKGKHNP